MNDRSITGVVLAGGMSRRMGSDKALLMYHGLPQLVYVVELLQQVCVEVVVSGYPRTGYENRVKFIPDEVPYTDSGPIGGVLTAWKHTGEETALLVVGCDYPFFDHEALTQLLVARDTTSCATAFVHTDGTPEPLLTIYEPTAIQALRQLHAHGQQSMKHFLKENKCVNFVLPSDSRWLISVDYAP